jgi:hypothetical protein
LNANIVKILIGLPDPGFIASRFDQDAMFTLWKQSGLATTGAVQDAFTALRANGFDICIVCVRAPASFLSAESGELETEPMIAAYIRYVCGCLAFLSTLDGASGFLKYVEAFDEPDLGRKVSPTDLVAISMRLNAGITGLGLKVNVVGPGCSRTLASGAHHEPYTDAYVSGGLPSVFTLCAEPNPEDLVLWTDGETGNQDLLYRCIQKNVAHFSSISWNKERWVTSFGAIPVPYPVASTVTDEDTYVVCAARAFCAILESGFSAAIFHRLRKDDGTGLFRNARDITPWGRLFSTLGSEIPRTGSIYVSEVMAPGDETVKGMVLSSRGDKFVILLCRPNEPDALAGSLRLVIRNPLWSDQYKITELTFQSYPPRTDLEACIVKKQVSSREATIQLSGLPYESTVLVLVGEVKLNPPLDPPPIVDVGNSEMDDSPLLETILQVPVHYGKPSLSDLADKTRPQGSFYYDTKEQEAKVLIGAEWKTVTMLSR